MPTSKQTTPGSVLNELIKKHGLNYNRLAKAIGLSSAMVRLIALDQNPVSAPVAIRFAKFFKNKPEYWLALQLTFDLTKAAKDKKLEKELNAIVTVDKAVFTRKKRTTKAKPKAKTAGKTAKRGKTVLAKKPVAKKPAAKKSAAAKKPAVKKPAAKKPAAKKAAATKKPAAAKKPVAAKKPAAKKPAAKKPAAPKKPAAKVIPQPAPQAEPQPVPQAEPPPAFFPEANINEPQI